MVTGVEAATRLLVTVKVPVVAPAATVTLAGVVVEALLSNKVTETPPAGAGPVMVTVPVELFPPIKLAGLMDTDAGAVGLMVRVAVFVAPP